MQVNRPPHVPAAAWPGAVAFSRISMAPRGDDQCDWQAHAEICCMTSSVPLFCASLSSHPLATASHMVRMAWAPGCCPQYCGTNRRLSSGCSSPSSQGQWSGWLERQNAEIHCMKSNIVPRSRWQRESEYQTQLLIHHLGKGKTSEWRNDVPNRCTICLLET